MKEKDTTLAIELLVNQVLHLRSQVELLQEQLDKLGVVSHRVLDSNTLPHSTDGHAHEGMALTWAGSQYRLPVLPVLSLGDRAARREPVGGYASPLSDSMRWILCLHANHVQIAALMAPAWHPCAVCPRNLSAPPRKRPKA